MKVSCDEGYVSQFSHSLWKLVKWSLVVAKGKKCSSLYFSCGLWKWVKGSLVVAKGKKCDGLYKTTFTLVYREVNATSTTLVFITLTASHSWYRTTFRVWFKNKLMLYLLLINITFITLTSTTITTYQCWYKATSRVWFMDRLILHLLLSPLLFSWLLIADLWHSRLRRLSKKRLKFTKKKNYLITWQNNTGPLWSLFDSKTTKGSTIFSFRTNFRII